MRVRSVQNRFDRKGADVLGRKRLQAAGVRRIVVGGLATEYCVLNTVKDARSAGYQVVLMRDAIRVVEVDRGDGERAIVEMKGLGVLLIQPRNAGALEVFMNPGLLLTDLYQLTMLQTYRERGMQDTAVFELFVRKMPEDRSFLMAAGLEQALAFLETASFTREELDWLAMSTSADAPYLDCAYKLQEYGGRPRRKRSESKATWPGRKQVYRSYDANGQIACDTLTLADDVQMGEPLLQPVMKGGSRIGAPAL